MTTYSAEEFNCAVCGKASTHNVIMSTNTMEPPDLDLRPGEMQRSTMDMWVQRCPHCGYCAPSIDEEIDGAGETVESEAYRAQLKAADYPELARDFLCSSMLLEGAGEYAKAGSAALQAAWSCDDHLAPELARECRGKAFELLSKAREQGQAFMEDEGEEAVLADILRRSGRFEQALEYCKEGLKRGYGEVLASVLEFEMELIKREDTGCYTVADALPESML